MEKVILIKYGELTTKKANKIYLSILLPIIFVPLYLTMM